MSELERYPYVEVNLLPRLAPSLSFIVINPGRRGTYTNHSSNVYFQANCSTSFIKDLIDHLKSNHELKVFNFEVQKRFHNHVKLLKEMKLLQKRYLY